MTAHQTLTRTHDHSITADIDIAECAVCGTPVYGTDAHPCCAYWHERNPGRPCIACAASRLAANSPHRRRTRSAA